MKYEYTKKHKTAFKVLTFLTPVICYLISDPRCLASEMRPLNDLQVIEVGISRDGLTRITVKDDRISNVFGVTGEYVLETDEDQGQVFIRPMGPGTHPISLTFTTEHGHTQDLRLIPKDKAPEALILQANDLRKEDKEVHVLPSRGDIEDLLYACQENRIPVGYTLRPLDLGTLQGPYQLTHEISNKNLRRSTFEVKNSAMIPWILSESGFAEKLNTQDIIAILMPKKLLKPGESAHVYTVSQAIR